MAKQEYITLGQVAAMLGVSTRMVKNYESDDTDPLPLAIRGGPGKAGQYDIGAVHQWGIRRKLQDYYGEDGDEIYNYEKERARLTHEQADRVALEVAQSRGELIPAAVVEETWGETITNIRARLLALPTRAAHQVEAADSLDEIRDILTAATHEALAEIATDELSESQLARIDDAAIRAESGKAAA